MSLIFLSLCYAPSCAIFPGLGITSVDLLRLRLGCSLLVPPLILFIFSFANIEDALCSRLVLISTPLLD